MAQERSDVTSETGTDALETRGKAALDAASAGGEDESTERIKQEIEKTRDEMGETIDEIQDRLSFSNLTDQVTEQVNIAVDTAKVALYKATIGKAVDIMKDVTSGKSGGAVLDTVKSNPVPFVLIGAGAGLLAVKAYRGNGGSTSSSRSGGRRQLSSGSESNEGDTSSSSSKLGKVTGAVSGVAGSAYETVSGFGGTALDTTSQQVQNKPLIVGAVALAVGAAVGFAIPSTRYEGELMGETRDQLMDRAQSAASGLVDQASTVATDLVDQAKGAVSEAVSNSTGSSEGSTGTSTSGATA